MFDLKIHEILDNVHTVHVHTSNKIQYINRNDIIARLNENFQTEKKNVVHKRRREKKVKTKKFCIKSGELILVADSFGICIALH